MNLCLSTLFNHLNDLSIKYFLLTDFEGDNNSHDIDLFVFPADKQKFEEELFKLGWYRRKEPPYHVNHYFYYSPKSDIYLDVKFALSFAKGTNECVTYKSVDEPASGFPLNSKGMHRPKGFDAVILYAAHIAFKERGKLEEKHRAYLAQYLDLYRPEIDHAQLSVVDQIENWLLIGFPEDVGSLRVIIKPYFGIEKIRMTRSHGFKYGYGLSVLFLGTDGTGKTTLVKAVGEKLNIKNNRLYLGAGENHWTSHIMKRIYEHKINVRPFSKLYSLLKTYAVLPLEFSLRIAPVIKKSKYNITLIDRFPGFIYLDKNRVRTFIYKIILPNPDLVFFLYADPEVLVKRKPHETTLERSRNDIKRFGKVAEIISNGKYKCIDTSTMSVDEASNYIITEIFKHPKIYKTLLTTEPCS